ncbi:MAG: EamA family transporter RarD [Candidatus Adiutrix sp.]
MESYEKKSNGLIPVISAFLIWGVLPAYWKMLDDVPALQIVGHRILWAFVFLVLLVLVTGRFGELKSQAGQLLTCRKKMVCLLVGVVLITFNWFIFIWAVNDGRIIETSLGYYINPLTNVLVGVLILRERLSLWQFMAVILAALGVLSLTINYAGGFPWVALVLAASMTAYSLCKKVTGLAAISGLTIETAILAPLAALYFVSIYSHGGGGGLNLSPQLPLLIGAGVVTAIPLLLFAYSLNRLPLSVVGLVQYISPTISLIIGVFIYGENFTQTHLVAFAFIWSGLLIFTFSSTPWLKTAERKILNLLRPKR